MGFENTKKERCITVCRIMLHWLGSLIIIMSVVFSVTIGLPHNLKSLPSTVSKICAPLLFLCGCNKNCDIVVQGGES